MVATLISAYLEKHLAVNRTPGSYGFFKEQTEKTSAELADTEARLAELKNQTGLASVEEQRKLILDRAGAIQREVEQTNADYQGSQAKIALLRAQLKQLPERVVTENTSGIPNLAADGMRQKLYDLQMKKQDLLSKYTEKNFLVQETQRQINEAAGLLKKEATSRTQTTQGLNAAHQQTKLALVMEEANYASLQSKVAATALTQAAIQKRTPSFQCK